MCTTKYFYLQTSSLLASSWGQNSRETIVTKQLQPFLSKCIMKYVRQIHLLWGMKDMPALYHRSTPKGHLSQQWKYVQRRKGMVLLLSRWNNCIAKKSPKNALLPRLQICHKEVLLWVCSRLCLITSEVWDVIFLFHVMLIGLRGNGCSRDGNRTCCWKIDALKLVT